MTVLSIQPESRRITAVIHSIAKTLTDDNELCRYLGATGISTIKISTGIICYDSDQTGGTHAFSFTDRKKVHIIFGKALYIPRHQTGIRQKWNFEIDEFVTFYEKIFSARMKDRIANGVCAILPDECILGKKVNRERNRSKQRDASGIPPLQSRKEKV